MEKAQQPGESFRIAISASQPIRQQINRLWRALKSHSTVTVTGLGQALATVVDVVETLNKKGLVLVQSVRTSSVSHPEKRISTPQLDITISLKASKDIPEDRQKQIKSLFKKLTASKSGRLSVSDLMNLELSKAIPSVTDSDLAYAINRLMVLDSYVDGHVEMKDWQAYVASLCPEDLDDEQFANVVKHIEGKIQVQPESS